MGKKKAQKKHEENSDILSLDDVLALGGSEEDLALLRDLDGGDEDALDDKEDLDAEPINRDEIRNLVNELGIIKAREEFLGAFGDDEGKKKKKKKEKKPKEQPEPPSAIDEAGNETVKKAKKAKNKFKVQEPEVSSTVPEVGRVKQDYLLTYQPRTYLLVKPGTKWYLQQFEGDPGGIHETPTETCNRLKKYARTLYEDEINLYKKQNERKKHSESAWMRTVLSAGTTADRLAALTLLVQEAAVQNLAALQTLVGMVQKKGHRQALSAMDTLQELFLSELLPDGRKLRTFDQRPLQDVETLASGNHDARDKRLLLWYFEEQLKQLYADFIEAIKARCHDNVAATKRKAIGVLLALLIDKPENEKMLLSALVNKLGDQTAKMAAYTVHMLNKLVKQHPNMKSVVVSEVEQLLYRSHVSEKAGYYGVCFLNQLDLSHAEKDLPARLILLFFSFFKAYIKKGKVDSRMLSALLTGVNRAFPYAKVEQEKIQEQLNTLYQVVHLTNFNTSMKALMLLYQVMDTSDKATDRYYQALYRKLQDPGLKTSSKQNMFLNLLYKSVRKDIVDKRVKAFIRRLLQVCCEQSPQFICGALFLLSEVLAERPGLLNLKQSEDQLVEDEEEHFTDIPASDDTEKKDAESSATSDSEDDELPKKASWVHLKNFGGNFSDDGYNPHQRNPLFCHADRDSVWELHQLALHYHPTVELFANKILQGERISYSGDPLQDFTLIRFLDRFVYRNPKKKQNEDTAHTFLSRKKTYVPQGMKGLPVNSEEYLCQGEQNVPVDEKFFFKYFTEQKKAKLEDEDSDASEVSDAEFDDFLDEYEKEVGMDGDADFKADFAGEFKRLGKKKGKKSNEDSDQESSLDEELSDEEPDFSDDEQLQAAFQQDSEDSDGLGEEDVSFSDNDELGEFEAAPSGKKKRQKAAEDDVFLDGHPPGKKKKKVRQDESSLFAAAEDFGDLIDENIGNKLNMGGSEALSNRDKADAKQLKWEQERDEWIRGVSWKQQKRKHGGKKAGGRQGGAQQPRKHSKPSRRNKGAQPRKRKK